MGSLTTLCLEPGIFLAEDFVTEAEIEQILEAASRHRLSEQGIDWKHDETGFSCELPTEGSPLLVGLNRRIYHAVGIDNDFDPTLRYRHYGVGEYHPSHCDHFEFAGRELIATAMLHLRDTPEGGETYFPRALPSPLLVPPKRARLVVWYNHRADGDPDPLSRHEGRPVLAGEKATLTNFLYKPRAAARLLANR